jgi:superfamily I DNA/RNA helicase
MPTVDELVSAAPNTHGVLIAGPGAGKSFNIGRRVDALREQEVSNDDIVLLTLTNATARTLRTRFPSVPVRTVHTYTLTALARLGALARRRVADRWEQKELVRRDMQRLAAEGGHAYRITVVDDFLTAYGTGFRDEPVSEPVLTEDEAILRAAWNRVREFLLLHVFDDFAPELEQLLREGRHLPEPPRAIVVDEYQDLTAVELRLIQLISSQGDAGVFACGDDMQSIYGFRDAAVGGLKAFPKQYDIDAPAYLSESRRCPKPVIDLAEEVAARAPGRASLAPRPRMTSLDDRPGEVRICTFPSLVAEARWVTREVARRRREAPDDSVAVIVPSGLRHYLPALNEASQHSQLDLSFADSRKRLPLENDVGFRFAYAVLRLSTDVDDQLAWRTTLNVVPRQPADRISRLYDSGETLTLALRARAPLDRALQRLVERVTLLYESIRTAGTQEEVMAAIDRAAGNLTVPTAPWADLLSALEDPMAAEEEEVAETAPEHARALLIAARRAVNRVAADVPAAANEVLVYTVFQAKGQEWDHAFLAGAYRRGFRDQGRRVGEGSRVLYVALTRARKSLTISKFNSAARKRGLIAAIGTSTPAFPEVLVEAAAAAGVPIEALGPQA